MTLDDAALQVLREMHEQGDSQAKIAKALHVTQKKVWRTLRGLAIPAHPVGRRAGLFAREGGSLLHAARRAAGINQSDLARAVGVGSDVISRLEGIYGYGTSPETAGQIAACLGKDR